MDFVIKMLIAGGVMGVLDALWLSVIATKFYKNTLGPILLETPNMVAAGAFYIIYIVGVVYFAISTATDVKQAIMTGALFGFVAYATYDLTNLATIKHFNLKLVVVDLCWGAVLTATVSGVTYWLVGKL